MDFNQLAAVIEEKYNSADDSDASEHQSEDDSLEELSSDEVAIDVESAKANAIKTLSALDSQFKSELENLSNTRKANNIRTHIDFKNLSCEETPSPETLAQVSYSTVNDVLENIKSKFNTTITNYFMFGGKTFRVHVNLDTKEQTVEEVEGDKIFSASNATQAMSYDSAKESSTLNKSTIDWQSFISKESNTKPTNTGDSVVSNKEFLNRIHDKQKSVHRRIRSRR